MNVNVHAGFIMVRMMCVHHFKCTLAIDPELIKPYNQATFI
jgi:hypothetical protein